MRLSESFFLGKRSIINFLNYFMNKKMFKEIRKGSRIKVISGKYKGLVDSVFFFNRKKNIIYLDSLIKNLPSKSINDNKKEKKTPYS